MNAKQWCFLTHLSSNSPPDWKNERVPAIHCHVGGGVQVLSQVCGRLVLHLRRQRKPAGGGLNMVTLRLLFRETTGVQQEGQLPRSRVVSMLLIILQLLWGLTLSRSTDTRGHGFTVRDELLLPGRGSWKCEVEFTHYDESHVCSYSDLTLNVQ